MRVRRGSRFSVLVVVALVVGACTGGGSVSSTGDGGGAASGAPPTTNGGGGGGAATLNACSLLSTAEIEAAVGWPVAAGKLQNSDGQTDCGWDSPAADGGSVGLTISDYDDSLWQAGSTAGISTAVSGIGDAAYKGWPHAGDLAIKYKNYEVDVAIIDFVAPDSKVDGETLALAKLVLSRI